MSDNHIASLFNKVTQNINEDLKDFAPLKTICNKYNQQPAHVVLAIAAVVLLFTLIGLLGHTFVTIFGVAYPGYMSLKAINKNSNDEGRNWLTYWLVFGLFTAFDKILAILLFFLPGYYFLKAIFYLWMFYPRFNGAQIIYEKFLKPQLIRIRQYEGHER